MKQEIDVMSLNVVKCYSQKAAIVLTIIFNIAHHLQHPHPSPTHTFATFSGLCFLQKYYQGKSV